MDEKNMEETEAFDFSGGASDGADAAAKAKKKKLIIFSSVVVVIVLVAGAGIISSLGGSDEFSAPPQAATPPSPLAPPQQDAPTPVLAAVDGDPFLINDVAPPTNVVEVSASEFDVLDELAQVEPVIKSDLVSKVNEAYQPPVKMDVQPPVKAVVQPSVDVDANLPIPDHDLINHKTQKAITVEPQASAAGGFCLDEKSVAKLLDSRFAQLNSTLSTMQSELKLLESKLSQASAATAMPVTKVASNESYDNFLMGGVTSAFPTTNAAQPTDKVEDNLSGKYFRVVGAMRGMAWLAVKGGDPVRLMEGDVLKGFGLVEKISADGRIWTDKGKVPTRILR